MLLLKLAFRNLRRRLKKTIPIYTLIIVVVAVLFIANSIFESTNTGIETAFIGSFTGNAAIGEGGDNSLSIFGNELPILDEYETIPPVSSYNAVVSKLEEVDFIEAETSIVSVLARFQIGPYKLVVPVIGIEPESYFSVCDDLTVDYGDINMLADNGVFLNDELAGRIEASIGRELIPDEPVSFTVADGNSFRIRTAPFKGVYRYKAKTEALVRVVLADLGTVRSLANYTLGYGLAEEDGPGAGEDDFLLEDLFAESSDIIAETDQGIKIDELESSLQNSEDRDQLVLTDNGAWSFILLKAEDGSEKKMLRQLKNIVRDQNLSARLLSWRQAAGSSAQIVFAVQMIFYIGIGFIGFGAVLVIMNALVISVLERTNEIGTMRSIGASAGFIRRLFMFESMVITMGSGLTGIITGAVVSSIINNAGVELVNPILITLFGGKELHTQLDFRGFLFHFILIFIVGMAAWIYPVSVANRIQPLSAMNKE